jgi:hypothetical protein
LRIHDQAAHAGKPANQEWDTMIARNSMYNAPIFLGSAFVVMGLAVLEKFLNLFGKHIPLIDVFPRTLIDWAVALLMFEIALSIRQIIELRLDERRPSQPSVRSGLN